MRRRASRPGLSSGRRAGFGRPPRARRPSTSRAQTSLRSYASPAWCMARSGAALTWLSGSGPWCPPARSAGGPVGRGGGPSPRPATSRRTAGPHDPQARATAGRSVKPTAPRTTPLIGALRAARPSTRCSARPRTRALRIAASCSTGADGAGRRCRPEAGMAAGRPPRVLTGARRGDRGSSRSIRPAGARAVIEAIASAGRGRSGGAALLKRRRKRAARRLTWHPAHFACPHRPTRRGTSSRPRRAVSAARARVCGRPAERPVPRSASASPRRASARRTGRPRPPCVTRVGGRTLPSPGGSARRIRRGPTSPRRNRPKVAIPLPCAARSSSRH